MVLETDKPFNEDSMFTLEVGPEKEFHNAEMIQFTNTEARELWVFLSSYYADETRYKVLSDSDGHYFLVPVAVEVDFKDYLESVYDETTDDELPMPEGVKPLNTHPSFVTFSNPEF